MYTAFMHLSNLQCHRRFPGQGILAVFVLFLSAAWIAGQASQVEEGAPVTAPVVLFGGDGLENFYTYLRTSKYADPKGVFRVVDGVIRISGEEWGGLTTREAYRDYHLVVEWRWGGVTYEPRKEKARDSGILIHGVGADGAAGECWLESIEHQIIEGGCGDFIMVAGAGRPALTAKTRVGPDGQLYWDPNGVEVRRNQGRFNWFGRDVEWKDILGFRGRQDVENPAGEWNRSEVICDGSSIINLVNGKLVNHGTKSTHTAGKIQIQSEGAEILVRRVELRPIDRAAIRRLLE